MRGRIWYPLGVELDATLAAAQDDATLAAGARARAPHDLSRGTSVGRFLLLGRIGAGAMGVVHAAYDLELDRRIALKLVVGTGDDARARLLRGAQALARLAHPNIVAVHDVGTHDERVWIAMELADGDTLSTWARAAPRSTAPLERTAREPQARPQLRGRAPGKIHPAHASFADPASGGSEAMPTSMGPPSRA